MSKAYEVGRLKSLLRSISLICSSNGKFISGKINDEFKFAGKVSFIEEAFVTYQEVEIVNNKELIVKGKKHSLNLRIESQDDLSFELKPLVKQSKENSRERILNRISVRIPQKRIDSLSFTMIFQLM